MTALFYQAEEYCLFLSEYELFTEDKAKKNAIKQEVYFKETEIEKEQISLKIEITVYFLKKDVIIFLHKKQ